MPYVVGLIVVGIILGPYGGNFFTIDDTIGFIGEIGLVFLMFMAGLETKLSTFSKMKKGISQLSFFNSVIPFAVGLIIATYFGYDLIASLLIGIIFVSSSIAVIIPSLESNGLLKTKVGKSIISATMIEDILSLVLFSIVLQTIQPTVNVPLPLYYLMVFAFIIFLTVLIPKVEKFFIPRRSGKDLFERELRLIFAILIATVILFEILGMHSIIAGFFVGLVLSDTIKGKVIKEKIHALSYGLFIPTFFIIVGSQVDLSVLTSIEGAPLLVILIIIGSVFSKFLSGFFGGKSIGLNKDESLLVGASTIPQLSTTLAVVFTGAELGLLDQKLVVAMIILSIITTLLGPLLVSQFSKKITETY